MNLRKDDKISVLDTFEAFSIFRPEKSVKKHQGRYILNRLAVLYPTMYDMFENKFH
jgi:hypothetical protein